jgi:signal transduction histidine kinase
MARILLVDDEPSVRLTVEQFLSCEGHEVFSAAASTEAMTLLENNPFDLLVSDSVLDGNFERAKKLQPGMPVVLISGGSPEQTAKRARSLGAIDYLVKPFEKDAICRAVSRAEMVRLLTEENRKLEKQVERYQVQEKSNTGNLVISKGEQLQRQQKLEAIGTLASGVAHEINNPINGILNYAQIICDTSEPGDKAHDFAFKIIEESRRVATIVRNLLDFSRQEIDQPRPVRICDVIGGTFSLAKTIVRKHQIELRVEVPEDLPPVRCRSQQMQQVILNLITNARDALNARFPGYDEQKVVRVSAEMVAIDGQTWIRTTVEDHGAGIPPAIIRRVFEPFFTTKDKKAGTGLGLAVSHGIVLENQGRLSVESKENQYTKFHIYLPVMLAEKEASESKISETVEGA